MTVISDRFVTNVIASEGDGCISVWSERRQCFYSIDRDELLDVWHDIHTVWMHKIGRSSLSFGCGRETFAYWVKQLTGCRYPPEYLRAVLEIGIALEWVIPNRGKYGYSCFNLRPIRYEHLL